MPWTLLTMTSGDQQQDQENSTIISTQINKETVFLNYYSILCTYGYRYYPYFVYVGLTRQANLRGID